MFAVKGLITGLNKEGVMAFKGTIAIGTRVEAELSLDRSARGTASIFIAHGSSGVEDADTVAPGGSVVVSITPDRKGMLRVYVDVDSESDEASLEVRPRTPVETEQGDRTWTYAVI